MKYKIKIGTDIDQCICDFYGPYFERFGKPKNDYEITRNVNRILKHDKEFWLNLPVLNVPDFQPELFCTKRVNPKSVTKKYLAKLGFGNVACYQMFYQHGDKSRMIKGRCDLFVDDSVSNFVKLNLGGVPCLLMDSDYNKEWGDIARVHSLCKEELLEIGYDFIKNYYSHFRDILKTINYQNMY